jgi:signal transduction histidine kinase
LSVIRAELDVTLSNPDPTMEEFVAMAGAVRQASERSERLIDSLLTLARSESATLDAQVVDLEAVSAQVVAGLEAEASTHSVRVERSLAPVAVRGDRVLLERLIENLVENAVRYNRPGGFVEVVTGTRNGTARVVIRNSGEPVGAGNVDALFEPFRRLGRERTESGRGTGLGLAIVRAVARAHGGTVAATALETGGLEVRVELPGISGSASRGPGRGRSIEV